MVFTRRNSICLGLSLVLWGLVSAGCGRFQPVPATHYVYVTTKQGSLRDRVAAVSNRTGNVSNGDKLKVLDHARHWVKVQTAKGEIGWIEEKAVATEEQAADFDKLKEQHAKDPTVASGMVHDQVYMHIKPGRDSEHFFLLNEGEKLQLLRRATLEKTASGASIPRAQRPIPQAAGTNAARKPTAPASVAASIEKGKQLASKDATPPPPPAFEDWWLARDSQGHTGWLYSRMVDVDAPDALTRYAEGQKFVGAYVLTHVHDEEAPGDIKDVPIYVAVLAPYKAGLPYDFDQVRVFTWSTKMHRYETAFRERNIEGFLPVEIKRTKDPWGKSVMAQQELPGFSFRVLAADAPDPQPDPETGVVTPGKTITKTYRLESTTVHRIAPPGTSASEQEAHPAAEEKKDKKKGRRR